MSASIHNVYSDLLVAFSHYLNNKILDQIKIQSFEFNIGNESFKLDYEKTNYSLPAAIVALESPRASINRPNIFRTQSNVVETIPVLYDHEKDISISIVEDLYNVNFTTTINCESQLQALTIQQTILNYIPVGKYLHFLEYSSFLEIDEYVLNPYLFDIHNDTIDNLFFKQNRINNTLDYCFSISYNPLIRLSSINVQLDGSVSNSSFQVQATWESLSHIPAKFLYPPNIEMNTSFMETSVNAKYITIDNALISVSTNESDYDFIEVKLQDMNGSLKDEYYSIPFNKNKTSDDPFISSLPMNDDIKYTTLSGIDLLTTPNIKFQEISFTYYGILKDNITSIEGTAKLLHNLETKVIFGYLEGTLSGKISQVKLTSDGAEGWFNGLNNANKQLLTEYVYLKYEKLKIKNVIDKPAVSIRQKEGENWAVAKIIDVIDTNNIYSNINVSKTNTILQSFRIYGVIIKDSVMNDDFTMSTVFNTKPSDDNTIIYKTEGVTKISFTVEGTVISFTINPTTGEITELYSQVEWDIITILFEDIKFFYSNVYGTRINNINIRFNMIDEPISTTISLAEMNDKYSATIIYTYVSELTSIDNSKKQFKLKLNPAISSKISIANLKWEIRLFDQLISDITTSTYFKFLPDSSTAEYLLFECTDEFYFKFVDNMSSMNPLKFSILFN